jgi:mannose-6-phosphate isomerase-like protein (cupin superfamily)
MKGDFVWHAHLETDQLFNVLEGQLDIQFREGTAIVSQGQILVVSKGVEHKPRAERECHVLLVEPVGTPNTGDAGEERTVVSPEWI